MADNLMDVRQIAEYLQMNKMTIYKLAREGKIPAFKVASEWRFRKDLIDEWLIGQLKEKPGFEKVTLEEKKEAGRTVLVVDDDETIQDYFGRVLKDYRVVRASTGEEALEITRKNTPDLVLLDIRMPGIDGIETLRRIKEIDDSITVIMLSAYGDLQTNLEAARLGAHTSLAKPFDLPEMKAIVADALRGTVAGEVGPPTKS